MNFAHSWSFLNSSLTGSCGFHFCSFAKWVYWYFIFINWSFVTMILWLFWGGKINGDSLGGNEAVKTELLVLTLLLFVNLLLFLLLRRQKLKGACASASDVILPFRKELDRWCYAVLSLQCVTEPRRRGREELVLILFSTNSSCILMLSEPAVHLFCL